MFEIWVLPTLIVMAGVALLTAAALAVATSTRRVVWKSFWCPLKKLRVTVGFLADRFRRDRYGDVLSCSAFAAPWRVSCDKRCLNFPEAYKGPTADEAGATPEHVPGRPQARGGSDTCHRNPHAEDKLVADRLWRPPSVTTGTWMPMPWLARGASGSHPLQTSV